MNKQAFGILEFDPLRALLRRGAQTDDGRARIDALAPIADQDELRRALRLVAEFAELRQCGGRLSFDGIADTSDSRSRLRIEGTALDPLAILDLARLCDRAMAARAAILADREAFPTLFAIVSVLTPELSKLAARLHKKILPSGELDDRASPQLATIRHEIARARSRITRSLESLMRRSSEAIQEELVTIRNDRFVIPVRSDHQGRIKGVAHGSSSSGATIFVEPLETIEANNELQTLRETEQREIVEILFELSEDLRRELPAIEQAATAITELDFISAKAAFAERFDCVVPEVAGSAGVPSALSAERVNVTASAETSSNENTLELVDARHPLLEESLRASGASIVPVSLKLDSEHSVMVISGANAGGKTVVLKTAGLLSLMALSGLPVPAKRASVPFYRSILADIGDHQSLAANLSTFTSHVANIGKMIELCEAAGIADILPAAGSALVLVDEVGTGTDPEEGSALGVAVVDHFRQCGAHVLATTHYAGLKMYAASEPGVLNASVEFDEKTLQPTYRLLVGIAGSSSGLEIAQRFGIPGEVISKAREQVKKTTRDAVEYLRRIKREAEEAESLRQALEEERAAVAEKFSSLDEQAAKHEAARQADLEKELSRKVKEFEEHSRELVAKIEDRASRLKMDREAARRTAELKREAQLVAQIPGKARASSSKVLSSQLRGVRVFRDGQVVSDLPAEMDKTKPIRERVASAGRQDVRGPVRDLKIGDRVRLLSFGSVGIVNHIRDDEAEVRVGSLRMREKLENLELVYEVSIASSSVRAKPDTLEALRRQAQTTEVHLHSNKQHPSGFDAKTELKLIGKKTDEAVELTDKFLDEAFLNGLSEVRIIHGHGTGALRRAITELLKDHPHVARFAAAPQEKGGSGATVVELKQ
jgi:DNA mismatch repair protein MutS2